MKPNPYAYMKTQRSLRRVNCYRHFSVKQKCKQKAVSLLAKPIITCDGSHILRKAAFSFFQYFDSNLDSSNKVFTFSL